MSPVILYDYWRSSASYRVRIALNLAGIIYQTVAVDLLKKEHRAPTHLARNPQGLVPALFIDGCMLTQSLAIVEYLDETREIGLLPKIAADRVKIRSIAHSIAMDIHPICNLHVVSHVMELTGGGDAIRETWMKKFIAEGLAATEILLQATHGPLCFGDQPSLADICLLPQLYNARRWGVDLTGLPRISAIALRLDDIPAFQAAHPDKHKSPA